MILILQHQFGGTGEIFPSGRLVYKSRFKPSTSKNRSSNPNHLIATFGLVFFVFTSKRYFFSDTPFCAEHTRDLHKLQHFVTRYIKTVPQYVYKEPENQKCRNSSTCKEQNLCTVHRPVKFQFVRHREHPLSPLEILAGYYQ